MGTGSKFLDWFIEQHGPRESDWTVSDQTLRDLISNGARAEVELRRRLDWDRRKESALYAWQARD